MRIAKACCLLAWIIASASPCLAQVAASTSYSFEYTDVAAGGSMAQTADYAVVDVVKAEGVDGTPAASASYSTEPAIGSADPAPTSAVSDWMLY